MRFASALALCSAALLFGGAAAAEPTARPAPEFPPGDAQDWLNSAPLRLADLRGKVVLIDFWTFACEHCQRSLPWLSSLAQTFAGEPLQVIGVHTPEFAHERPRTAVAQKVAQYGITFPVLLDNDYRYWNALRNRYWPAYYLIDRRGRLRAAYVGEVLSGGARAAAIESRIRLLLSEGAQ